MPGSVVLPFQQTPAGASVYGAEFWVAGTAPDLVGALARRSRVLPWLRIVRVLRFGLGRSAGDVHGLLRGLLDEVDERPVLRLHIEVLHDDPEVRCEIGTKLRAHGFRRSGQPRSFTHTVRVNLDRSADEILAGLHPTARRHIRAPGKRGFEVRRILDSRLAPAVAELYRASFRRTRAFPPRLDFEALIDASRARSSRVRVVGLFPASEGHGPVSFAAAYLHGDVAEYAHAGSMRIVGSNMPVLYAPTWDLMCWARQRGARVWDFGGVDVPQADSGSTQNGIADFKRYFSRDVVLVGEEWVLEARAGMELAARSLRRIAGRLRKVGRVLHAR